MSEETMTTPEATVVKARRERKVQKFIVGKWVAGSEGVSHFEPCKLQPETALTDVNEIVAWTKANMAQEPGEYQFVREVPGALVIAVQQNLKFTFA